jgi:hypothetical protein
MIAVAIALGSAVALTGCEKPAPSVTVFSGTTSAHREAICWSFEPTSPVTRDDCSIYSPGGAPTETAESLKDQVAVIPTRAGETVGISVDTAVAETGWQVSLNRRPLSSEPITEAYFRFTMPPARLQQRDAELIVQAFTDESDAVRGVWVFGLTQAGAE